MATKKSTKKSVKVSRKSAGGSSFLSKLRHIPLAVKILVVVALVAAGGIAYGLSDSNSKEAEYAAFANNGTALPENWAKLEGSNRYYQRYLCQQIINGKLYARGIVVKEASADPLQIAIATNNSPSFVRPQHTASNVQVDNFRRTSVVYYGGLISAPAAEIERGGWAKITIAGTDYPIAQAFMPVCDKNTRL